MKQRRADLDVFRGTVAGFTAWMGVAVMIFAFTFGDVPTQLTSWADHGPLHRLDVGCAPPGMGAMFRESVILYSYPIGPLVSAVLVNWNGTQVLLIYSKLRLEGVDPNVNDPTVAAWQRHPRLPCQWRRYTPEGGQERDSTPWNKPQTPADPEKPTNHRPESDRRTL